MEDKNENTKRGEGGKVRFPIPLSSRLTIGYKHVSSCDVTTSTGTSDMA